MKKIYLLLLVCFVLTVANAQRFKALLPHRAGSHSVRPTTLGVGGGCDTLNTSLLNDSVAYYLPLYGDTTYSSGFFTGTNALGNLGNAQYFDASSSSDNYITRADIFFGYISTYDTTKIVPVDIFDGTGNTVGALLGTANLTLGQILNSINDSVATSIEVDFYPAIKLPASKQFFVAVDYSNLHYYSLNPDGLAILSTFYNQGSGAWEYDSPVYSNENGWHSFVYDWTEDVSLWMLPYLSTGPTCGSSLPVQLILFTAQAKESDVLLNWQVAQEVNMKEYDVERAGANLQFGKVGAVQAINSPLTHSYSYTDLSVMSTTSGDLFYRLKQVNKDGSFTYSNTIRVVSPNGALSVKVVNPFNSTVQVHITSPVSQNLQAAIYDVQGRKVAGLGTQMISAGDNVISIPAGQLAKGMYILNLTTGGTVYKYKILNQ